MEATTHQYGRHSYQVGIGLGQRLGALQVQHTAGDGPHPPQGAGPLLAAGTARTALGRAASCLDPPVLLNATVLTRSAAGGGGGVRGSGLLLVDPGVEDGAVHHLWLLGGVGGPPRRRVAPGEDLRGSAADHEADVRARHQAALGVGAGVLSGFGAVKVVRCVGRFTRRGGSMQEARKLLWDVALPALLQQSTGCGGRAERSRRRRGRVSLVRPVVCTQKKKH